MAHDQHEHAAKAGRLPLRLATALLKTFRRISALSRLRWVLTFGTVEMKVRKKLSQLFHRIIMGE
jgi:hypothetical protein